MAQRSSTTASRIIYIRVRRSHIVVNPNTTNPPPTTPQPPGHLYVIEGAIEDIGRYAGTTVDWVIKVARLICDPSSPGRVYTHTTGTPSDWYHLDRDSSWRRVVLGDPLLPGIYEFEAARPITLSKISRRQSHSLTSVGSESSASTFRHHIELRDDGCVVTRVPRSLVASHLIPKRMGTEGAKDVVTRFVGAQASIGIHRFSPDIGVLLVSTLDSLVDSYKLGFYHVTVSTHMGVWIRIL
jgi:hypothetical protein